MTDGRLAGVDQLDRRVLHDRRRALLDRQRHLDRDLLRVARVLHVHLEGEVGGGDDRVLGGGRELLVLRQRHRRDDPGPVQASGRAAGRGAVDAQEDLRLEAGARHVRVQDEVRLGHDDAADPLLLEHRDRRAVEEVRPDDVARRQPLRLRGEQRAGLRRLVDLVARRSGGRRRRARGDRTRAAAAPGPCSCSPRAGCRAGRAARRARRSAARAARARSGPRRSPRASCPASSSAWRTCGRSDRSRARSC